MNQIFTSTDNRLHADQARLICKTFRVCDFTSVKEISVEAAEILSLNWHYQEKYGYLRTAEYRFDGLTSMSPELARAFSRLRAGHLKFNGLKHLTFQVAREMAHFDCCRLELNGLESISVEAAKELVDFPRRYWNSQNQSGGLLPQYRLIELDEPKNRDPQWDGTNSLVPTCLFLNGLKEITPELASALASAKKKCIELNGIDGICADTLKLLIQFDGGLSLKGLTNLSVAACKELHLRKCALALSFGSQVNMTDRQWIYLIASSWKNPFFNFTVPDKYKHFSVEYYSSLSCAETRKHPSFAYVRRYIKRNGHHLVLDDLDNMSVNLAKIISKTRSFDLHLDSITSLTKDEIIILSEKKWKKIYLNKLEIPQAEIFLYLVDSCEELHLLGAKKIDSSVEKILLSDLKKFFGLNDLWKNIYRPRVILPEFMLQDIRTRNKPTFFQGLFISRRKQ